MNALTATSDNFSWKRVAAVASFYRNCTDRQLLIYGLVSLLFFVLTLLPFTGNAQAGLFTMIWTILPLLLQMSPVVLSKHGDSRVIERLMPAKASEKFAFFLIYFLIVIPVFVYLLPELALVIYIHVPAIQTEEMLPLARLHQQNYPLFIVMNAFSSAAGTLTCLYVVLHARHNRTLKGILSVFAVMIAIGILGAFYGAAAVFKAGYIAGSSGEVVQGAEFAAKILDMMEEETWYVWFITFLIAGYCCVMLRYIYLQLRRPKL